MANTNLSSVNTLINAVAFVPATNTGAGTAGNVGAEQINASSDYRVVTNQPTAFQTVAQVKAAMNNLPVYASVERHDADYVTVGTGLFQFASGTTSAYNTVQAVGRQLQFTSVNGTNNNVLIGTNQMTIGTAGVYKITATVGAEIANANAWFAQLTKNATSVLAVSIGYNNAAGANGTATITYVGTFIAGDTIDIRMGGTTAGTITVHNLSFNAHLLTN